VLRLTFFGCATDRSPGEKPTGLGRVQFLGVWTEHGVIGRRCAGGLEVRTTLHQTAEQIAIVPNWLVDDLSEPVDFHRPMRRTDLEERIGPECRDYPSAELRLAQRVVVLERITGRVRGRQHFGLEALQNA